MSDPNAHLHPAIHGALRHWDDLAAYAWGYYRAMGRGILLLNESELTGSDPIRPSFMPLSMIPQGDEYRGTIRAYDPERDVLLLVQLDDDSEPLFFSLSATDDGDAHTSRRLPPPSCFERLRDRLGDQAPAS